MSPAAIETFFAIEPAKLHAGIPETPVPLIDLDVAERNLRRWQKRCDDAGIHNRPHVKTHKMTALARYQVALGATGITVQKLGEAEVMSEAGIADILVTFNIVGRPKLDRLSRLARTTRMSTVADNPTVVDGLAGAAAAAGNRIDVLVECDTGGGRNGVQTPEEAVVLAERIGAAPMLNFKGLMTFPRPGGRRQMAEFLAEAATMLGTVSCVSAGGTPDMWNSEGLEHVTEYRAGTYIFNDLATIASGACTEDDCAVDVLATVVSRPTASRAIIDAGSKSLTSDKLGEPGYGRLRNSDARLYGLTEEHGMLDASNPGRKLDVGDHVRIIPNHVCPVINLFDRVAIAKAGRVIGYSKVDARGKVA